MKKRILIVDDSETNLLLLQAILEEEGYLVEVSSNVAKAHERLNKKDFHLILLDLLMPHKTGFDMLKELKEHALWSTIPVVVVTAYADGDNRKVVDELGAEALIEKPIDIDTFMQTVNAVFNNH
ncbi:MAG: response regulator [Bacteroidales bacterium]